MRADANHAKSVGNHLSLCGSTAAGWANEHDLGRASERVVAVTDSQHSCQVVGNLIGSLVRAVHREHELVERLEHGSHIDVVFLVHAVSHFVRLVAVDVLRSCNQVLLDACQRIVLADF